jgi:hypothetical protein
MFQHLVFITKLELFFFRMALEVLLEPSRCNEVYGWDRDASGAEAWVRRRYPTPNLAVCA